MPQITEMSWETAEQLPTSLTVFLASEIGLLFTLKRLAKMRFPQFYSCGSRQLKEDSTSQNFPGFQKSISDWKADTPTHFRSAVAACIPMPNTSADIRTTDD